ncbi:MAG: hypothetical protein WC655_13355 [Candidatus Hydrogenedentales bacterium]|jgi:hypothetical protein
MYIRVRLIVAQAILMLASLLGLAEEGQALEGAPEEANPNSVAGGARDPGTLTVSDLLQVAEKGANTAFGRRLASQYDVSILPLLLDVYDRDDLTSDQFCGLSFWIGAYKEPSAVSALMFQIQKPMPEIMENRAEFNRCRAPIMALQNSGSQEAIDFLAELATESYWMKRNEHPQVPFLRMDQGKFRGHVRNIAMNAIVCSGSDAAVQLLSAGDRVPQDMRRDLPRMLDTCQKLNRGENPFAGQVMIPQSDGAGGK